MAEPNAPRADPSFETLHLRISGRVQGVGYRFFTEAVARELGLTGWVRNCADGSVEVLAQGPRKALMELVDKLHSGPPFSRVDDIRKESAHYNPSLTYFDILS